MTHETRKGLRIIISLLHMGLQAILIWSVLLTLEHTGDESKPLVQNPSLSYLGLMCGLFFIYYTAMKLLSRRYSTYNEER